jgi:predicted unusual protein kinase regulating ubiquinone biosynthesis (AarF/ABC1/UbiB family)
MQMAGDDQRSDGKTNGNGDSNERKADHKAEDKNSTLFKKVPGRFMRTLKTGGLTSALGGSFLGGKVMDAFRSPAGREKAQAARHVKNATRIVETMAELRGPIMKIGQLLSTHTEALPTTYTEMLSSLQSQAPPMPYADVRKVIIEDLGAPPEELFARFDERAHAAASIGQVHRAWLKTGEAVAVKVQYPGAAQMVDGDLKNLESAIKLVKTVAADMLRNKKFDLSPVYEEIAEHIRQETDACRESFNARMMAQVFAGEPQIKVPDVHLDFSGLKVITYEFIEGKSIKDFITEDATDQADAEHIASLLTKAFWGQLLRGGVLHADPHPGNYLVTPTRNLALLDYGCVKIFEPHVIHGFLDLAFAYVNDDDDGMRDVFMRLDMLDDPNDPQEFEDLRRIGAYFCLGVQEDKPFSFVDVNYVQQGKELIEYFISRRRIPKAQKEFLFLTRVVLGYYEYFSRLKLKMNFHQLVMPFLSQGWQGRQIEIPTYYLPEG